MTFKEIAALQAKEADCAALQQQRDGVRAVITALRASQHGIYTREAMLGIADNLEKVVGP